MSHRVCRYHPVGRISHDHGPVGKGRAAVHSRRRPHMAEQMGSATNGSDSRVPMAPTWPADITAAASWAAMDMFTRLEQFVKLQQAPKVKYADLEASISTRITYNVLPMQVRVDYVRVTEFGAWPISRSSSRTRICNSRRRTACEKSEVHLLGRVTSMTHRPITTFEKPFEVTAPPDMLQKYAAAERRSIRNRCLWLRVDTA